MKFIPGTKFINKTTKNTKFFQRNIQYTLFNVKKDGDVFKYTFKKMDGSLKVVKFESIEAADNYLQTIIC